VSELLEYLEDCIEILVLMQYDLIPFRCQDCDEYTMTNNKCGIPYDGVSEPVIYIRHTQKEYFSCPVSMVPDVIFQWYDHYRFIKEFNTPMQESDTSLLFWWFVKTYQRVTNEIEAKIQEEKQKQMDKKKKFRA